MSFPIVAADVPLEDVALPAFVVAGDGLYLRKRSLLGLSQTKVERIAHLPAGSEFLEHALPKLPSELLGRTLGFFKAIFRERRSEAIVLLTWGAAGFELAVPHQQVTSWSLKFTVADDDVPAGYRVIGTIHSHGALGAGASLVDEADEADLDGLHLVFGDMDRRHPSVSAAVAVDGRRWDVPPRAIAHRIGRAVDPPADWLTRVTAMPPSRSAKRKWDVGSWSSMTPSSVTPTRGQLDATLKRVESMATSLGYRLTYELVSAAKPALVGGGDDA